MPDKPDHLEIIGRAMTSIDEGFKALRRLFLMLLFNDVVFAFAIIFIIWRVL